MYRNLVNEAIKAREFAYAPYSHYKVGAALLTKSGKIYHGCNIENAAYTPSNCAERTAIFKAVSEGEMDFEAIAIVAGLEGKPLSSGCTPCGVCRQVMVEFCAPTFKVILGTEESYEVYDLKDLLPKSFNSSEL